jgi:tRNA A37 threonylcarbamoyladenosine dehydratase
MRRLAFVEDVAKTGLRFFVLIDPDVITMANLATQHCYVSDVGRPKVYVLKKRIQNINPLACQGNLWFAE